MRTLPNSRASSPTGFLIDKNGKVLRRYVAEPDWAELHQLVERALRS
jgi:glutathione peroxidase-family protein